MPAHPRHDTPDPAASAPLARCAASLFYDALLLAAVLWCASLPVTFVQARFGLVLLRPAYQFYLLATAGAYFIWHWTRSGQTLAMKTWRLRIVTRRGAALTVGRALLRYVAAVAGLALLGSGFLWALVDRQHAFLHDRLAGTRIVSTTAALERSSPAARRR
jgi:uncharacterized RDD family membrane protein YckC